MTTEQTATLPADTKHWAYDFADEVALDQDTLAIGLVFHRDEGGLRISLHSNVATVHHAALLNIAIDSMVADEEAP